MTRIVSGLRLRTCIYVYLIVHASIQNNGLRLLIMIVTVSYFSFSAHERHFEVVLDDEDQNGA